MRKRNLAALLLLAVISLTACGGAADTAVTTEEIVVPEMSSKDMLVNSLEYLLEETENETGEEQAEEEELQAEDTEKETEDTGEETGVKEKDINETGTELAETDDGAADEDSAGETALIFYGKDMESGLTREEITAEEVTPDVLLNALARHNIVPLLDTKALSMEEREEDGRKLLYLDLSGSFREYLMTMSMEAECIIISSIVNTFTENYDADAVYITVKGETLVTSHAAYTEAVAGDTPEELMARLTAVEDEKKEDAGESEEE